MHSVSPQRKQVQVGGDRWGQGLSLILPLLLTDGAAMLKLLNLLGLSFLTCEVGSQKLLHSIPGAELSPVGRVPGAQRVCGRWGCCPGAHSFAGEADVLAGAARTSSFRPRPGQGTQSRPLVLEGQSAWERSWEYTTQ